MHQRNYNHRFLPLTPSSRSNSLEEGQEDLSREDRKDEHHPASTFDDWEIEEDPLIFFDGLDMEERRVDLPCDDDGQVFLAPHRKPEALRNDGKAKLLSDKLDISAKTVSVDESPVVKQPWSQSEFGFEGDDDLEKTTEPIFEPPADQPVRMEAITDAFISQKILPSPSSQDAELDEDSDQNDWVGEQLALPAIKNAIDADKPSTSKPYVAKKATVSVKTILAGIGQIGMSSSRSIIQGTGVLGIALGAMVLAVSTKLGQILQTLVKKAVKFAMLAGLGAAKVAKAAYGLCLRIGRYAAPRLYAVLMSLLNMLIRLGQGLNVVGIEMASAFGARTGGLQATLRSGAPTIGRAYLNDINKLMSLLKSVFNLLMMKAVQRFKTLSRMLADTSSRSGIAFSQLSSAGSVSGIAVSGGFAEAIRKASHFLRGAGGRAWESTTQQLKGRALLVHRPKHSGQLCLEKLMQNQRPSAAARESSVCAAALGAEQNAFIIKPIQQNLMALASVVRMPTRVPLGGLAGVAAVVVLLAAAWVDTPKSEKPSVVLAFPPKPSGIQEKLSDDPIIFDWSVIETPQDESESVGTDDAANAEPPLVEDGPLSPSRVTSVDPVEDAALVDGGP